jgi:hypothetical protein
VLVSEGDANFNGSCDPYVLLCYHRPGADDVYEDLDAALADGTGFAKTGTIADSLAPVWPDEQACPPFAARALAAKRNYNYEACIADPAPNHPGEQVPRLSLDLQVGTALGGLLHRVGAVIADGRASAGFTL